MPIYAYRCSACGYQNDYLQKISDPLLSECPECGKSTFQKQVTAAGFQLKGSGWYVTDFRDNGKKAKPAKDESKGASASEKGSSASDKGSSASDKGSSDKGTSGSTGSSSDSGSKPAASSGGAGASAA